MHLLTLGAWMFRQMDSLSGRIQKTAENKLRRSKEMH